MILNKYKIYSPWNVHYWIKMFKTLSCRMNFFKFSIKKQGKKSPLLMRTYTCVRVCVCAYPCVYTYVCGGVGMHVSYCLDFSRAEIRGALCHDSFRWMLMMTFKSPLEIYHLKKHNTWCGSTKSMNYINTILKSDNCDNLLVVYAVEIEHHVKSRKH